jgi:type I restriction enzyme S subunit
MSNWHKPLSTVTTFISRGISPKYDNDGYVVINQRCVRNTRIDFGPTRFSNREKTKIKPEKLVQQWDVVVNSTGVGTLGRIAQVLDLVQDTTVDSHVSIVRPNLEILDGKYFGYALVSRESYIETLGAGATGQTELSRQRLAEVEIPVHSLDNQHKIASILSAYDDLIENNLRRIKILEEMAQTIYREWFVKFRFPGHEKVRMVDSPLGKIPEGWSVIDLVDSCNIVMGQSPKSEFYNTSGDGLPFHQGVTNFGPRFPTERVFCTVKNRIAESGDILLSVRAPVGRINLADKRLIVGRGLCAIHNKNGQQWFTLHQLKERFQQEDTMGGGTIFKAVTRKDVESIEFLNPANLTVQAFEEICHPIEAQIKILTEKNNNLRRTLDFLLPKLISGELDVSDLDIKTGGHMQ